MNDDRSGSDDRGNGSGQAGIGDLDFPVVTKRAAPLRRDVVDALRKAIIDGRLAPGTRLIERELIDLTGVSRTVIREALRQLESESIVETIPNKGPIVRELTKVEAVDLYAIRAVLEGLAARMFVENGTRAHLAAMEGALKRTEAAYGENDPDHILKVKNEFYSNFFDGAGSEILSSMIGGLYARIWRWRALGLGHPKRSSGRSKESLAGMRDLLDALVARDGDRAEQVARLEVTNAGREIMKIFDEIERDNL